MPSAAYARGRVTGAAIVTFFGAVWCFLALAFWPARPGWIIAAASGVAILLIVFCVQRFMAWRKIPGVDDPVAVAKGKRAGMWFGIIFGAEGLLIWLCATLLEHLGLGIWIPVVIAVIVGLHFLPLARVFEVPLYYWTGTLCILGAIASSAIPDAVARSLSVGFVMAAVLWLTAFWVLMRTYPVR